MATRINCKCKGLFRESYGFIYNSLSYIGGESFHAWIKAEGCLNKTKLRALNEPQCLSFHNVSIIAILSSILLQWPRLQIIQDEGQFNWLNDESLLILDFKSNISNF